MKRKSKLEKRLREQLALNIAKSLGSVNTKKASTPAQDQRECIPIAS
jgi:hypothetical protein